MRKYADLGDAVENLEKTRSPPKPEPEILKHPLYVKLHALGAKQALFVLEICNGLMEVQPPDWYDGKFASSFLCNSKNRFGLKKQAVFDMLEGRNGAIDVKTRAMLIEVLQFSGKTKMEAEKLVRQLHIHLIREVSDLERPVLKQRCSVNTAYQEFSLYVDTNLWDAGPAECRAAEMGPYRGYQQNKACLVAAFQKNLLRWRRILETEECITNAEKCQ